jgi:hypothetical protein
MESTLVFFIQEAGLTNDILSDFSQSFDVGNERERFSK